MKNTVFHGCIRVEHDHPKNSQLGSYRDFLMENLKPRYFWTQTMFSSDDFDESRHYPAGKLIFHGPNQLHLTTDALQEVFL